MLKNPDMSKEFWVAACTESRRLSLSGYWAYVLYASHGAAASCFVFGSVFSGVWLCRWARAKHTNPPLWRFVGKFLILSSLSCIFGIVASVSKISVVQSNIALASSSGTTNSTCHSHFAARIQSSQSQAVYRMAHSFEVVFLLFSLVLSVDRLSAHLFVDGAPAAPVRSKRGNIEGSKAQHIPLLPMTSSSDDVAPVPEQRQSKILLRLLRGGIFIVSLCFVAFLAADMASCFASAKMSIDYRSASDNCNVDGSFSTAAALIEKQTSTSNGPILSLSVVSSFTTESIASSVVMLLYIVVGYVAFTFISQALEKLHSSRSRLIDLQSTTGNSWNSRDAQAAAAGTLFLLRDENAQYFVTLSSFERFRRRRLQNKIQTATPGRPLLLFAFCRRSARHLRMFVDLRKLLSSHALRLKYLLIRTAR